MDIVRAIKFPLDDRDWLVKVLIGTALSTIIPFFAVGYQVRVARRLIRDARDPLPPNNEIGQTLVDGLMATLALLIYFLPIILIVCLFAVPSLAIGDNDIGFFLACVSMACVILFALLYAIPAGGMYWMGVIRYAETGDFMEFFRIMALWGDMMLYFRRVMSLWLYSVVLGLIGAFLSPIVLITVIGVPLLGFWYQIATGHLIGQAGLEILREEHR